MRCGRTWRITRLMSRRSSCVPRGGRPDSRGSGCPRRRPPCRGLLLGSRGSRGCRRGDRRVEAAGVTVGADAVGHLDARCGPRRHRPSRPKSTSSGCAATSSARWTSLSSSTGSPVVRTEWTSCRQPKEPVRRTGWADRRITAAHAQVGLSRPEVHKIAANCHQASLAEKMPLMSRSFRYCATVAGLLTAVLAARGVPDRRRSERRPRAVRPVVPRRNRPLPVVRAGDHLQHQAEARRGRVSRSADPHLRHAVEQHHRAHAAPASAGTKRAAPSTTATWPATRLRSARPTALFGWLFATDVHGNRTRWRGDWASSTSSTTTSMWRAYNASAGWQPQMMSGKPCAMLGARYKTACHRDHIH